MNPQVREVLKDFWKYAFCTDRPVSRFEFLRSLHGILVQWLLPM